MVRLSACRLPGFRPTASCSAGRLVGVFIFDRVNEDLAFVVLTLTLVDVIGEERVETIYSRDLDTTVLDSLCAGCRTPSWTVLLQTVRC